MIATGRMYLPVAFLCLKESVSLWLFILSSYDSLKGRGIVALKGGIYMTLNLLFITVTFNKKQQTFEEMNHNENVLKHFQDTKAKQYSNMTQIF